MPQKFMLVKAKQRQNVRGTNWLINTLKDGVFSGPYFPVFGLNTEIYEVILRIQSEYRKILTRKNSVFEHFSRSGG